MMNFDKNKPQTMELVDAHLGNLGLWRKQLASDESSLFRAVAEQIFLSQALHPKVRNACINHLQRNRGKYAKVRFHSRCGELEMHVLSDIYRCDFYVYQNVDRHPINVTKKNYKNKVVLCLSEPNQYDSVYPRSYLHSAAVCQSILYELLYTKVFGMEHAMSQAAEMMSTKSYRSRKDSWSENRRSSLSEYVSRSGDNIENTDVFSKGCERSDSRPIPPFPYKVAKALDAKIYRNISLDSWIDSCKEQQQKELQLAAELQFMPGDKCQVTLEGYDQMFNAHIQDLAPNRGPVSVFVEDLGEKHTVPYSSLKSLIQSYSQGWSPVKNLPGQHQKSPGESDSPRKTKGKKRKDMPVLITPSSRGTGLPPRLMALEARSGKISASQRNTNAIGLHPRAAGVYNNGSHPVPPRQCYSQLLRGQSQGQMSASQGQMTAAVAAENGHLFTGSRSFENSPRSPRQFQQRFTFDV